MKRIPNHPYLQNIVAEWQNQCAWHKVDAYLSYDAYHAYLKQFGFVVPINSDYLEFPDDFPDEKLMMFMLRWG